MKVKSPPRGQAREMKRDLCYRGAGWDLQRRTVKRERTRGKVLVRNWEDLE